MEKSLRISEHFYSLHGEGKTIGTPSVFLRLTACNLLCDDKWTCTTTDVWITGKSYSLEETLDLFEKEGYEKKLFKGSHLVITGGEPLLQQSMITEFVKAFYERFFYIPYLVIETNGTKMPNKELCKYVNLFNVSPKLSNAGMDERRRIKPEIIRHFNLLENSVFKFVIGDSEDWKELKEKYLKAFDIRKEKIWLVPSSNDVDMLRSNRNYVANICVRNGLNYSSRLQLELDMQ